MADYRKYEQLLQQKKRELLQLSSDAEYAEKPVELDQQSIGRLSRMDAIQGQQMAQASKRRREQALQRIDAALRRIAEGDYGYCVECGEDLDPKRLEIDPTAQLCVQCLSDNE